MCNLMNYYRVSHLVITTRSRNKTASHLRNSCMHSMPAPYFQSSTSFWFLYHTNVNLAPHPFFFFLTCDVSCLFLTISVEELRPGNCTFMGSSAYSSLSSAFPANWQLDPEASTDRSLIPLARLFGGGIFFHQEVHNAFFFGVISCRYSMSRSMNLLEVAKYWTRNSTSTILFSFITWNNFVMRCVYSSTICFLSSKVQIRKAREILVLT